MRVMIVGAGIGGLTAALCLLAQGFEVVVYERAPELQEVGAGLQIGPNGAHVLHALGLAAELQAVAFRPQAAEMRRGDTGQVIFSLPLGADIERRYQAPYYHVHRADLQALLLRAVQARAPHALQLGRQLRGVQQDAQGVTLDFIDGSTARGELLVGADGVRSVVRKELFGVAEGRFTGMSAWRMTVPSERLPAGLVPPNATVWVGARKHVVTYYLRGGALVNLVGVVENDDWPYDGWTALGGKADILSDYEGWHPVIRQVLAAGDDTEYYKWALRDLPALPHWTQGRVALLGDACHPMLPFLAQGAVMAIEDAWVLAACLAAQRDRPEQALQVYVQRRRARATRVQDTSRRNGQLYHQQTMAGQWLTRTPLWLVSRVSPDFFASRLDWLWGANVTVAQDG